MEWNGKEGFQRVGCTFVIMSRSLVNAASMAKEVLDVCSRGYHGCAGSFFPCY